MPGAKEYVHEYGNIPFTAMPFNDADNIAVCGVFYMNIEDVVPDVFEKEPKSFGQVCEDVFEYNGRKHIAQGLVLPKAISKKLVDIGKYPRFADMKITGFRSVFDDKQTVQFAAATFLLPDGNILIVYRGTDDSFCGWREDLDILVNGTIPSHKLAHDYLEEVAATYEGNIIIAGHSKGGHIALYAALNCTDETQQRIISIYNNDGPGFADYTPFKTARYREILPKYRHIVPHASFVGMLLAHDRDYTVVKSSRQLGPMQHDLGTWQIVDGEIVTKPEMSLIGRVCELSLIKLLDVATKEQINNLYEIIFTTFDATGQTCLKDFAGHLATSIKGIAGNWKTLSADTKEMFSDSLSLFGKIIMHSYNDVKAKSAPQTAQPAPAAATV